MKFKIDENLPIELVEILSANNYDALTVMDQNLAGNPDNEISSICQAEGRAIISLDIGFSDIRQYPPSSFPGIIVLRLKSQDKNNILALFQKLVPMLSKEPLSGHLWIVDETKIRIRQ